MVNKLTGVWMLTGIEFQYIDIVFCTIDYRIIDCQVKLRNKDAGFVFSPTEKQMIQDHQPIEMADVDFACFTIWMSALKNKMFIAFPIMINKCMRLHFKRGECAIQVTDVEKIRI